ncbi:hypothetical protein ACFVYR_12315 [Streptomyces sp. NPDC058284]|uniref:hypothetical protein n=1 Tax=unclassified Streptomyces TaxID=2593676 RepID=UPI003663AC3F
MLTEPTAEERREQETYQRLLAHLDGCTPCQTLTDCEEGGRIRRALRAARAVARAASGDDANSAQRSGA